MDRFRNVRSKVSDEIRSGSPAKLRPTSSSSSSSSSTYLRAGSRRTRVSTLAQAVRGDRNVLAYTRPPAVGSDNYVAPRGTSRKAATPSTSELASHAARFDASVADAADERAAANYVYDNAYVAVHSGNHGDDKRRAAGDDAAGRHKSFGAVPAYLRRRQQEMASDKAAAEDARRRAALPPGMKRMSDEERAATVATLRDNMRAIENELAKCPLRVETHGQKAKKASLEARVTEIEEALRVFQRKNVYIQE
jgi:hypothetical protein